VLVNPFKRSKNKFLVFVFFKYDFITQKFRQNLGVKNPGLNRDTGFTKKLDLTKKFEPASLVLYEMQTSTTLVARTEHFHIILILIMIILISHLHHIYEKN
jgi:hypothetical protein